MILTPAGWLVFFVSAGVTAGMIAAFRHFEAVNQVLKDAGDGSRDAYLYW